MQKLFLVFSLAFASSISLAYNVLITNNSTSVISIKDNRTTKCSTAANSSGACDLDAYTTHHASYYTKHGSHTLFILQKSVYQTMQVTPIAHTTAVPEFLIDIDADHEYIGSLSTMKNSGNFHYNGSCHKSSHNINCQLSDGYSLNTLYIVLHSMNVTDTHKTANGKARSNGTTNVPFWEEHK